jgi:hypothetical protein
MATKGPDYSSIVLKLLEKSIAGKVEWKQLGAGSNFLANLDEGFSFEIQQSFSKIDTTYTLVMRDSESRVVFDLSLTDDPETMISDRQLLYEALGNLYDLARRKALNVDEKVERVSEILERI